MKYLIISLTFGIAASIASFLVISVLVYFVGNDRIMFAYDMVYYAFFAAFLSTCVIWPFLQSEFTGAKLGVLITVLSYFVMILGGRIWIDLYSLVGEYSRNLGFYTGDSLSTIWVDRSWGDIFATYSRSITSAFRLLLITGVVTIPIGALTGRFLGIKYKVNNAHHEC